MKSSYNLRTILRAIEGENSSVGSGSDTSAPSTSTPEEANPWTSHNTETPSVEPTVEPEKKVDTSPTTPPVVTPTPKAPVTPPVTPTTPPPPVAAPTLTPEQISELVSRTTQNVVGTTRPSAPVEPAFTDADFNKTFNVPVTDASVFESIVGYKPDNPSQVQSLHNWGQNIVRQAVTMAMFQIEQTKREVQSQMEPVAQMHRRQTDDHLKGQFFTQYPHLGEFKELVQEIVSGAKRSGNSFDTPDQMFKFVADRAHVLLGKAVQPGQPGTQPNSSTPQQPVTSTRTMTPTSVGGQVSASVGSATRMNDAQAIFG
jgi:hypothetical protein